MRSLFAIAVLMLALLFVLAPAEAACASGGDAAVAADVTSDAARTAVLDDGGHCPHVPCSDTTHSHLSGGCAAHSFVPAFAVESPHVTMAQIRIAFAHEVSNGRTPLPPVPPPLA
jgi:hypothetical protein